MTAADRLTVARRNVRIAWAIYYGSLMAGVVAAWFIGVATNAYWVTLPLSLILGAVVVLTTGGRLADVDHELAAAEADDRFALADAISRHPAGGAR